MRNLEQTRARWKATFTNNSNLSDLKAAVRSQTQESPCVSGLRSICWKAFLVFENLDQSTWSKTLWNSRSAYTSLKDHFLKNIDHPDDLSATDPLADDESSPWNTLRRDEMLRDEIYQDVERCMPENLYFREPATQDMLLNILFIFCKLNSDVGYRQGMHEVLAPILWVTSRDAIDPQNLEQSTENSSRSDELLKANLDARYIEHDSFTLFAVLMQTVKSFYELGSNVQTTPSTNSSNSPIIERSRRIHEDYLRKADPELTEHLTSIEILPQIFLIRWIRLLFGREFPFEDVLSLWDALFAEDPTLDLVDYICVAMLLRIRWQLIESDYSSALTLLLRYPAPSYPNGPCTFLDDALYLRENILLDGGTHIISKYSSRTATSPPKSKSILRLPAHRFSNKGKSKGPVKQDYSTRAISPRVSPTRLLREQGGIEGILQEAAKGVYNKGERWGVAKALRDAVSGLQSGSSSPRRVADALRWSLDDGKDVSASPEHLTTRIKALEDRNKALAKMLENAMEDLWLQQKKFDKEKAEAAADALSLAIAKVQFVQVYLEDSTMPLPIDDHARKDNEQPTNVPSLGVALDAESQQEAEPSITEKGQLSIENSNSSPPPGPVSSPTDVNANPSERKGPSSSTARAATIANTATTPTDSSSPQKVNPQAQASIHQPRHQPFHQPRPSLAQSSFSWMLGEDQRKSSFISASPFPPEKRRESAAVRGKNGFLFGDEKGEGKGVGTAKGKDRADDEGSEDGFTMGTLRGVPEGL